MICKKILISGNVQGVGFRHFVHKHALEYGVSGFAENLANGDLEVAVCCDDMDRILKILKLCEKGPALARVDSVIIKDFSTCTCEGEFKIVY